MFRQPRPVLNVCLLWVIRERLYFALEFFNLRQRLSCSPCSGEFDHYKRRYALVRIPRYLIAYPRFRANFLCGIRFSHSKRRARAHPHDKGEHGEIYREGLAKKRMRSRFKIVRDFAHRRLCAWNDCMFTAIYTRSGSSAQHGVISILTSNSHSRRYFVVTGQLMSASHSPIDM